MERNIKRLKLSNGKQIFIEVDSSEDIKANPSHEHGEDLPEGAEPTGIKDEVTDSISIFRDNIEGIAETVHASLKSIQPSEWTVEMTVGLKGKTNPIPFIVTGEMNGGIKVTATWKKEQE